MTFSRAQSPLPERLVFRNENLAEQVTECETTVDLNVQDGKEPEGAFIALLMADDSAPNPQVVSFIANHRWTYPGAVDTARRGQCFSCFVWCLLQMQRNVQLQLLEEGDCLDRRMANACRSFVSIQGRRGRWADMYQLLSHFICNSPVWTEWAKYLKQAFEDPKANQEQFMVPRLDQVWGRFLTLRAALQNIFDIVDERFVWKHRLLDVSGLITEHMKKRCFPQEFVSKNELFSSTVVKDETLKQIKFTFSWG